MKFDAAMMSVIEELLVISRGLEEENSTEMTLPVEKTEDSTATGAK